MSESIRKLFVLTIVGTTLRLVIPVMGLFLFGLVIDAILGQVATWAIVGALFGFVVAAWLVYRQVLKIRKDEKTMGVKKPDVTESEKTELEAAEKESGKTPSRKSSSKKSTAKTETNK